MFHFECVAPLRMAATKTFRERYTAFRNMPLYNLLSEESKKDVMNDMLDHACEPCPSCRHPVGCRQFQQTPKKRKTPERILRAREREHKLWMINFLGHLLDEAGVRRPVRRLLLPPDHGRAFEEQWYLKEVREFEATYGELPEFSAERPTL